MKKSTPVIIALALMMVLASCKTPSEKPASSSGNKPEGSDSVVTTVPGGDSTTPPPAPEPDYLQFAVTEGDFGDLFRDEGKWEGERSVRDQIMSVTNSASDEKAVTWAGVCAGKSFEYETKLRVNSFAGSCVNILLDTETNLLSASVYADKITVNNGGSLKSAGGAYGNIVNVKSGGTLEIISGTFDKKLTAEAAALAESADIALLYLGLPDSGEMEGEDRADMLLPENQIELLKAIAAVNENIVVVLSCGCAVEMQWHRYAKAVVHGYLGGQAGAMAMARLLTGQVNFSGKLAETVPLSLAAVPSSPYFPGMEATAEHREGIYVGYRYYETAKVPAMYPFGFGLSYTTFEYSGLRVEGGSVRFSVKNTGDMAGAEIAQLYIAPHTHGMFRPAKELRGYLSDEKTDVRFVTPAHGCDTAVRVTVTDREGGRRSLFCPGAGGLLDRKDIEEAFISYPDAVLIQAGIPARAAAAAAVTAAAERVPVFVMSADGGACLPVLGRTECEIFSVAEEEIEACTGIEPSDQEKCMKACIVLSQAVKAKYIILRLGDGDRGYFLFDGKYYSFISACGEKKRRGIKTDGVFSAALVLEYMKSGGDIKRACGYAAVAAAAFVSRGGGLRAYPSADEIRRYTEKYAERAEEY